MTKNHKREMAKLFSFALTSVLLLGLCTGCGDKNTSDSQNPFDTLGTAPPLGQLGGGNSGQQNSSGNGDQQDNLGNNGGQQGNSGNNGGQQDNLGNNGGNAPSAPTAAPTLAPAPTAIPAPTTAPVPSFETQHIVTSDWEIILPAGWTYQISYWYQKASYIFYFYDPENPDYQIVLWSDLTLGCHSEASVQFMRMMMQTNGYFYNSLDWNMLPVLSDGTAEVILGQWDTYSDFMSSGDALVTLPKFTDFNVTDSGSMEGWWTNYGKQYHFDNRETYAYGNCKGPSGSDCGTYMYSAYQNAQPMPNDQTFQYFQALRCFVITAPEDYFNAYSDKLIECANSFGIR